MKKTPSTRLPVILLVDDDRTVQLLARQALEQAGYEVVVADDGQAAEELFDAMAPALVILDVIMPGQDGFATCAAIRARATGRRVPILMMTGADDVASIHRAFDVGATDFISKPIPWAVLGYRARYLLRAADALRELERSEQRLQEAQRAARLGHWEWTVGDDALIPSPMCREIVGDGRDTSAWTLRDFLAMIVDEDRELVVEAWRRTAHTGAAINAEFRIRRTTTGEPVWVHVQGELRRDDDPTADGRIAGTLQDITDLKRREAQTRYLAYFDTLTGLPNRVSFTELLERSLSAARRHGRTVAVLLLDLDQFKRINETLGHEAGDRLLSLVSARLRNSVRAEDAVGGASGAGATLARMGGDEFTILLGELRHVEDAERVVHRVLQAIREPVMVEGHEVVMTASAGIAVYPMDGEGARSLLSSADAAMYQAKRRGGNGVALSNRPMQAAAASRLTLEIGLRRALERDQLFLAYQPQLDLASGRIVGVEALLRWRHPELGVVSPLEFIPLAEETGLILQIGEWVIDTACRQARLWRMLQQCDLKVAINLSARQFQQADLTAMIRSAIDGHHLAADALTFEITESTIMRDVEVGRAMLQGLRDLGCRVAVDDFGTGYSSLAYLKQFSVDALKVDRSFIAGLPRDADDGAIVEAVIAMARTLGIRVVAEGVETSQQLATLTAMGCHEAQGYLISRPTEAGSIPPLVAAPLVSPLAELDVVGVPSRGTPPGTD